MKVSIITAVFNSEAFLDDYFKSLLNQSHKDLEIICVDDGSTDNSISKLYEYRKKYPDLIKVIRQKHEGVSQARNKALDVMSGDYYCFLDSDDWLSENALELALQQFQKEDIDASLFTLNYIYPQSPEKNYILPKKYDQLFSSNEMFSDTLDWSISAFGVYKSEFKEFSYYSSPQAISYDDEFQTRRMILKMRNFKINNGVYFYRQRDNSVSNEMSLESLGKFKLQYKTKGLLQKRGLYEEHALKFERQSLHIFVGFIRNFFLKKKELSKNESSFIEKSIHSYKHFINKKVLFQNINELDAKEVLMFLFLFLPFVFQKLIMKVIAKY
ncbi:glycosyltransferase family 2 protein [Flammeovirga sp. EKP202]|uniref:glycosyltransferase family 2 protein n=1 Tax=Flammeovirga sp. EKP202 TaxID=2770592 RepID=UPI00165F373F|nr:glycosyltransferase family 2 protein [Flammeovirga sp. EKP202]MBD0403561.1 glycosyltransferase family 2 protein [Flammeovirga sp. EKP202]